MKLDAFIRTSRLALARRTTTDFDSTNIIINYQVHVKVHLNLNIF